MCGGLDKRKNVDCSSWDKSRRRGMKVYISGPVTGNKEYKEQFGSMSYLLKREGHGAVNPVQIMEPVRGVLDYKTILQADLELLEGCDGILMMPGWEESQGAQKEYDKALRLGLKMFYADTISKLPDDLIKQEESNVVYKRD